jgi:putative membrane protein
MAAMMLLTVLALAALVVFLVRATASGSPPAAPPRVSPDEILAERLARGEIDEEEYQRRIRLLRDAGTR